jgi:hypothetical protein
MNITATSGVLPPYSGAFCGQLITMLEGPAQGRTSRIVGYVYVLAPGNAPYASIQVVSFDGLAPNPGNANYLGDQFVINGRPFSGTGFGLDLTTCPMVPGGTPPLQWNMSQTPPTPYTAPYDTGVAGGPLLTALETTSSNMPYALLPNHAQFQSSGPFYADPAGPGGANESYDAIDAPRLRRFPRCCAQNWRPGTQHKA